MNDDNRLFDLAGKTALITGGSRGLGLQLAEALGSYGARLLLTARKSNELQQAQVHLQERGIDAQWFAADGSNEADIAMLADAAMERLGHVDIPVSYTHLDVYKRQGQDRRFWVSGHRGNCQAAELSRKTAQQLNQR